MAGFKVDAHEVHELAAALEDAAHSAGPFVRDAMETVAIDVRDDWRAAATGMRGLAAYPRSIGYDFTGFQGFGSTVLTCEIGPDKGRKQGSFGAIVEYGSPTFAPRHYGDQALDAHTEQYDELIMAALDKAEQALTFGGIIRSVAAGRNSIL